jgi:glutamyl-tRNA synthetase
MTDPPERTRLAPSPTGALHLGNARTFMINWAMARRAGWAVLLRMEDLDGPRVKPHAAAEAVQTLQWLGLDWDEGPVFQSENPSPYREAVERLAGLGLAYRCALSRAEIRASSSAPHRGEHETPYPASLRPEVGPVEFRDEQTNWRFVVPDESVRFVDGFAGPQEHRPARTVGDFVVRTKLGQPAYQLAVVVDDARQGITQVVRGDDLLDSAARQLLLYRALGLGPEPSYTHLPLVLGADGRRLAKRHGDTRIRVYKEAGVPAERVVALLGRWCGMDGAGSLSAREFAAGFDLRTIPREPVVFTPEDDAWLRQASG